MISMSSEFKEAIKSDVRDVRGYIEVIGNNYIDKSNYTMKVYSNDLSVADVSEISAISELNNNTRVVNKYASFEKDYFLLDGSFILPSVENSNLNPGYISNEISNEEDGRYLDGEFRDPIIIEISTELSTIEGMTIYFDDDVFPTTFYYYSNGERVVVKNKSKICHIFDIIIPINNSVKIEIPEINTPNRRLKISEIDFGITNIYEGNELKEFEIIEKVDILKKEMFINECNIILNNSNNQFNSVLPSGIASYFNGAVIKAHIGVLTKTKGVEYCPCGMFYLVDWKNNSQTTTTLYCKSFFDKMNKTKSYFSQTGTDFMDDNNYLKNMFLFWGYSNYSFNGTTKNSCISDNFRIVDSQLEQLRDFLIFTNLIGYMNRYGNIIIENVSNNIVDVINGNVLKAEPTINAKSLINQIIINEIVCETNNDTSNKTIFSKEFEITGEDNQKIPLEYDENTQTTYSCSNIWPGGRITMHTRGSWLLIFNENDDFFQLYERVKGKTTITLTQTGTKNIVKNPQIFSYSNEGESIEINDVLFNRLIQAYIDKGFSDIGMKLADAMKNTADFIKENETKYSIELNYNGDPSLEARDLIELETRYGMMNLRIQEHRLKFNGGLSGSIKGVGN